MILWNILINFCKILKKLWRNFDFILENLVYYIEKNLEDGKFLQNMPILLPFKYIYIMEKQY